MEKNQKRSAPINPKVSMLNFLQTFSGSVIVKGHKPNDLLSPHIQYNSTLGISPEVSHFDAAFILFVY